MRSCLLQSVLGGALLTLAGCHLGSSEQVLTVEAPRSIFQAITSDDEALCNRLAVDFTMREVTAAGAILDRVPMVSSGICQWALEDEEQLINRGAYRMLVRLTATGAYEGRAECEEQGANPMWVGAYWVDEISFPFPADFAGFTEATFLSRPDDDAALSDIENRLGDSGISFDLDQDGFDNLTEFAGDSNACVPNQPPRVDIGADPTGVLEGEPITIEVSTNEPGGLQHDVVLSFSHANGSAFAPDRAEVILRPYAPDDITSPSPLPGQSWSVAATVDDPMNESPTAASWSVTFIPDEPFVGEITVAAVARQRGGGPAFAGAPEPLTIEVENVLDPIRILLEDEDGALIPPSSLDFAEAGADGAPTTLRLVAESQDIGGQVAGALELIDGPPGLTPGEDVGFLTLSWIPTNADAATPPEDGHQVSLRFTSNDGEVSEQTLAARVTPTFNDPPSFGNLATVNGNLSSSPFENKRLRFDVIDPDLVAETLEDRPTCSLDIWPEADADCATACCADAFVDVDCAPDGELDGDTWHMVATLTPGSDYFTSCGSEPSFVVKLTVSDRPPADASPAQSQTITTSASCGSSDDCWEHLTLRTSGLTDALIVAGWGGEVTGDINGTTSALIDGSTGIAVMGVKVELPGDGYGIARVAVVDLNDPPSVLRIYDGATELERLSAFLNYVPAGIVDEQNHRAVVYARKDGAAVMASVDLQAPYDVTTWPIGEFCSGCTSGECGTTPVVDDAGTVWVPCGRSGNGTLARITPEGTPSEVDLGALVTSGSGIPGAALIVDNDGDPWLLWPGQQSIAAIDLTTVDNGTPVVVQTSVPETYSGSGLEGYATSNDQREAYFAYNQASGDMAEVLRIRIGDTGPEVSPALVFGSKSATNNGSLFHRILVRETAPGALTDEPELLITGGGSDERPMVDTDAWTLLTYPRPAEDYDIVGLIELYESPLPDYYAGVVTSSALKGVVLFPWDPDQSPISQDLGVPAQQDIRQTWISSSRRAGKLIINKSDEVVVIDFPGAP